MWSMSEIFRVNGLPIKLSPLNCGIYLLIFAIFRYRLIKDVTHSNSVPFLMMTFKVFLKCYISTTIHPFLAKFEKHIAPSLSTILML